jgi:hypothetical protein
MFGPGENVRDPTVGITDVKDLPPPEIVLELFRNKRQRKLSSQKAMEGANRWVSSSETTVR